MTLFNIIDLILLFMGITLVIIAMFMDKTSSFDDGSFLTEMMVGVLGGILIASALIAKFIELFIK